VGSTEEDIYAGVSIVLHKKYITNWNLINEIIVTVELNICGKRITLLAYAPHKFLPRKKTKD
jgi:hypothetical protein